MGNKATRKRALARSDAPKSIEEITAALDERLAKLAEESAEEPPAGWITSEQFANAKGVATWKARRLLNELHKAGMVARRDWGKGFIWSL